MNYIVACKWLFLDGLTPEIEAETRISLVQSNWNEVALNFLVDFFSFSLEPLCPQWMSLRRRHEFHVIQTSEMPRE